jgi:hypothetical protein
MAWFDLLASCGTQQTLQRAQGVLHRNTVYKLGKGGMDPSKPLTIQCDCSGFIAWAIGIPRELPPQSNKWLSTDEYWAGGKPTKPNLCTQISLNQAAVGDLLVYPDSGGSQGHIALVTAVADNRPSLIIHCSNGNFKHFQDAIRQTPPDVFLTGNHQTRLMRINYDVVRGLG